MIRKLLTRLRSTQSVPRVYSRVVSDENRQTVVKLLEQATREANADQKKLVQSIKQTITLIPYHSSSSNLAYLINITPYFIVKQLEYVPHPQPSGKRSVFWSAPAATPTTFVVSTVSWAENDSIGCRDALATGIVAPIPRYPFCVVMVIVFPKSDSADIPSSRAQLSPKMTSFFWHCWHQSARLPPKREVLRLAPLGPEQQTAFCSLQY